MGKILVVDDSAFARMRTAKLLADNGFEVEEAANGAEAVRKYQQVRPTLVLMDITMPVMDGLQALREIKRQDASARVVMCSALGQKSVVLEAIKAGAVDFLVKPLQPQRLLDVVRKHGHAS